MWVFKYSFLKGSKGPNCTKPRFYNEERFLCTTVKSELSVHILSFCSVTISSTFIKEIQDSTQNDNSSKQETTQKEKKLTQAIILNNFHKNGTNMTFFTFKFNKLQAALKSKNSINRPVPTFS